MAPHQLPTNIEYIHICIIDTINQDVLDVCNAANDVGATVHYIYGIYRIHIYIYIYVLIYIYM